METKKCPDTTSGNHVWEEYALYSRLKEHRGFFKRSVFELILGQKCKACGLIDDMNTNTRGVYYY